MAHLLAITILALYRVYQDLPKAWHVTQIFAHHWQTMLTMPRYFHARLPLPQTLLVVAAKQWLHPPPLHQARLPALS